MTPLLRLPGCSKEGRLLPDALNRRVAGLAEPPGRANRCVYWVRRARCRLS